jgi:hypothetical protein
MSKIREAILAGKSVQEIANELGLGFGAVYHHINEDPARNELRAKLYETRLANYNTPKYKAALRARLTGRMRVKYYEIGDHLSRIRELIEAGTAARDIPSLLGCGASSFFKWLKGQPDLLAVAKAFQRAKMKEGKQQADLRLSAEEREARAAHQREVVRRTYERWRARSNKEWADLAPKVKSLIFSGETIVDVAVMTGINEKALGARIDADPQRDELREKLYENWLARINTPEHKALLSQNMSRRMEDPKAREHLSQVTKEQWECGVHDGHSEFMKELWKDPKFRAVLERHARSPERRMQSSERIKALWRDPAFVAAYLESRKSPGLRAKLSESLKESWSHRDFWEWLNSFDPDKRAEILRAMHASNAARRALRLA